MERISEEEGRRIGIGRCVCVCMCTLYVGGGGGGGGEGEKVGGRQIHCMREGGGKEGERE